LRNKCTNNLEGDKLDGNIDGTVGRLAKEGTDSEGARLSQLEHIQQVLGCEASVNDILDNENILILNVASQIHKDTNGARGGGGITVARNGHKLNVDGDGKATDEIGSEDEGTL
jgi:hypothetical protein